MKTTRSFHSLVMLCLFFAMLGFAKNANAIAPGLSIIGPDTVCIGEAATYTVSPDTPGRTYTWSVDPHGNISGPTVTDNVTVIWSSAGSGLLQVTDQWGNTAYLSVYVVPTPRPYITTNFSVACQSLPYDTTRQIKGDAATGGTQNQILDDSSGCIKVCDSSTVRYYANGDPGSTYTWTVTGGTIVTNYGDSIDVFWPAAGTTGTVTLTETNHGCTGTKQICVTVIQKPRASFAIAPSTTPPTGIVNVCNGTTLNFTDLSVGDPTSPIVSWYWNFGDGTSSSVENPSHTFTVPSPPYDTVRLIVRNQCNCTDTFYVVLNVYKDPGPDIECPSVVCYSDTATYSTKSVCGTYNWTVSGGHIVSGAGTNTIVVKWDAVGSSGFGYVSLNEPCGACPGTTTIKVPVITPNGPISGPAVVCVGKVYQFSLPLWPATQYMWGCIGNPGAILGEKNDYKVAVEFTSPGSYTLHAWYKNDLKLCGGNVNFHVTAVNPTLIVGDTNVCLNATKTYSLSPGATGTWTLYDPNGNIVSTSTSTTFTYNFTTTGAYTLTVTGSSFCDPDPFTILVQDLPPAPTSITGPDSVCLNRPYVYTAGPDVPGTIYNWTTSGGTIVPASGSNTVTVTWTTGPTMTLSVYRTNAKDPHCPSAAYSKTITEEVINPHVTGNSAPCANTYENYNSNYTRGEVYDWVIVPNTAGSVMSGVHSSSMQVLWNNTTGAASVVCIVHKCDSVKTDTLHVMIHSGPAMSVTGPASACPGSPVTFTATAGGGTYTWDFGDGTTATTSSNISPAHAFPLNLTTGNISYTVTVSATAGTSCPPVGTGSTTINILPGPVANISVQSGNVVYCTGDPISTTMVATITNNVGTYTIAWYRNGVAVGSSSNPYTATADGSYYVVVTSSNGCSFTSNTINITVSSCSGSGGSCAGSVTCNASVSCNTITLTGSGSGTSPQWTAATTPPGGPLPAGATATATYDVAGVYSFTFSEYFSAYNCTAYCNSSVTVGFVPDFYYSIKCAGGSNDSLILIDHTTYLPGWTIVSITWSDPSALGSGSNLHVALPDNTTYTITETVICKEPGGKYDTCIRQRTVVLPPRPSAAFTFAVAPICENVPINFTPTVTAGISGYNWNFGDGSSSALQAPQRNFDWTALPNPHSFNVKLTVTDTIGCTSIDSQNVSIYENLLGGTLGPDQTVCANATPVTLNYLPNSGSTIPTLYEWSNGVNNTTGTLNVGQSGTYWVTVFDSHQCQGTFPNPNAFHLTVVQPPIAQITGQQQYCFGDVVKLYGYAGSDPGITYAWTRNGSADGTTESISDAGLGVGTYIYQLTVTETDPVSGISCSSVSAPDTVIIYALPAPPVISGPTLVACSTYHLQLHASGGTGTYTWSNGTVGATDDIYAGGPYRLWITDVHGCRNHTDTYVPLAPSYYFPYFPSGCYTLCQQQLPDTLYGPPGAQFFPWEWLKNGSVAEAGTGYMWPYGIDTPGTYNWDLNNTLCDQQSPPMDVTVINCNCEQMSLSGTLTCLSSPASYKLVFTFTSPAAGTGYNISTNLGPVLPFNGTTATSGPQTLTLTFTTLTVPPPSVVTVELLLTEPTGIKCYKTVTLSLPPCSWAPERMVNPADTGAVTQAAEMSTAMMLYPNPTRDRATVSYDYGNTTYGVRSMDVYDEMGRRMETYVVPDAHGNHVLNTAQWPAGVYIVRMIGDGKVLQTQQLSVTH